MEFKLTVDLSDRTHTLLEKIFSNAFSHITVQPQNGKAVEANGSTKKEKTVKAEAPQAVKEEAPTETATKSLELKDLRALVNTKAQEDKRDAIRTLLSSFNVEKITELKPEQYAEFYSQLEKL